MIHKGRPSSAAGRNAAGPRVEDRRRFESPESPGSSGGLRASGTPDASDTSDPVDPFDPFESFDAHDRAAGRTPQRAQLQHSSSVGSDPSEPTYTRSRRGPGESKSAKDEAKEARKALRPTRSLKGRALGYLSRREYSRAELARKLKPYVEETDSLESVLDSLEAENWLSDSRFAESLVHRRASRLGTSRIVGEMKQHALDPALVEEAGAQLRETELPRAQAIWQKKFGRLPETPAEKAKQARFLASRGFSGGTIGKILKGLDEDWLGE